MIKYTIALTFCAFNQFALCAARPHEQPVHVSSTLPTTTPISLEQLLALKPESALTDHGTITALVTRPTAEHRLRHNSVELTKYGVAGDSQTAKEQVINTQLAAITLMRSDVSSTLGGAHVSGDNIHVDGLYLDKDHIKSGDLLVIQDPQSTVIKSVLMATDVPHYACHEFTARCGQLAHDFFNAEAQFENASTAPANYVNGVERRLRGIRLAVLQEGKIAIGDAVRIVTAPEKEILIHKFHTDYYALLTAGFALGAAWEDHQKARVILRKKRTQP